MTSPNTRKANRAFVRAMRIVCVALVFVMGGVVLAVVARFTGVTEVRMAALSAISLGAALAIGSLPFILIFIRRTR